MTEPIRKPSAKEALLESASLNPDQCFAIFIVNGEIKCSWHLSSPTNAAFLKWAFNQQIDKLIADLATVKQS